MPEYKDEENAWINTELSAVIEVLTKCWESSQRAAVNSGELRKAILLGGDICIEEEWMLLFFNGIGERALLEEQQPLQKHMVESEERKGFRALDPESDCLRTNLSSATYSPEVTYFQAFMSSLSKKPSVVVNMKWLIASFY